MVPLGTAYAASAFTGVFLGRHKIDQAKKYSRLTIIFNICLTIIILIVLGACHDGISKLFTKDTKTVFIINDVMGILILYIFFDTIHGVQSGIIRGLGLQVWGSIYTLICYYMIGLPLALYLAFTKDMGVYGLWLGFSIACIILDCGFLFIIECPNWSRIASEMQVKIDKEKIKHIEDSAKVGRRIPDADYAGQTATTDAARNLLREQALLLTSKSANRRSATQSPGKF